MEKLLYPTDAKEIFGRLRGRAIVRVRRQLLESDYTELDMSVRDQESDGPTELEFDDAKVIHFEPNTESMSVQVSPGEMHMRGAQYSLVDTSKNRFWVERIGRKVVAIDVLVSKYASPHGRGEFAVSFALEGDLHFVVEYLSDEQHTDALRVAGDVPTGQYNRVSVA